MEVCLPTDFYKLRDELRDWRDAPARDHVNEDTHIREAREDSCADTDWRAL